jgi:hypothetical protein
MVVLAFAAVVMASAAVIISEDNGLKTASNDLRFWCGLYWLVGWLWSWSLVLFLAFEVDPLAGVLPLRFGWVDEPGGAPVRAIEAAPACDINTIGVLE